MKTHVTALLLALTGAALADSTINNTNKVAYSANGGWLNWKWSSAPAEDAVVTESLLSGFIYSSNFGWINLGDGSPDNSHSYSQTGTDFGVNHSGGTLTGLAYGANIGWINFDWAAGNDPDEPRIDLATGRFSGLVYGANVGWIKLDASASAFLETDTLQCPDTDADGIADWWEHQNAGGLGSYNAVSDSDGDGATDLHEYQALTDPENAQHYMIATPDYLGGTFTLTFPSNPGRRYQITTSTTLLPGSWVDAGPGVFTPDSGTSTTKAITILGSPTEQRRYFRATAIKPLQP